MGSHAEKDKKTKPTLLFLAHPLTGHITPTLRIASYFPVRGFPTYFVGPTTHAERITKSGCSFLPLLGKANVDDLAYYTPNHPSSPVSAGYWSLPWRDRVLEDFKHLWINTLTDAWNSFLSALEHIHGLEREREVVVITESMFFGFTPYYLRPPFPSHLPRPRKTISLSIMVPFIPCPEVGPGWHDTLPFDPDPEGQLQLAEKQRQEWQVKTRDLYLRLRERLYKEVDCFETGEDLNYFLDGVNYRHHFRVLQLGVPGFFYPRQKWPTGFKFIGVLPPVKEPEGGWPNLPGWWEEVKKATDKKVVVVAQGTVEVDPFDLIIPTIEALASREDVLTVAVLGRKGAKLPEVFKVPGNARVTDYLHYDAILPYGKAWVHNGGYGAVQHGIAHGVPMVVCGEGQDKGDNCKRVVWSGIGIYLGKPKPEIRKVKEAVEKVIDEGEGNAYRKRARELREEGRGLDCFGLAERAVWEAVT
ncbi:UDP-Glycosyltransferase/glycogen phosphorylase [Podospora australis]|uniref:UDP-Glycosyltransferase/glycogen phosphorylase n=1 Tax=Podospora australis TaxID=1536484 RepID=A0AAN6WJ98_9PEZI|nr:UDP-Glycosyltransferase/glycogen phosphorylase [Podospora australis]